jgi:hypothetical protein
MFDDDFDDRPTFYDGVLDIAMPSAPDKSLSEHPVQPPTTWHAEDPFTRALLRVHSSLRRTIDAGK